MDISSEVARRHANEREYVPSRGLRVSENPVVSVTCWTYQQAPYIRQCLDSILMQETTFPYEVIIGEDGSTDGTREICIEYAERYPDKIRLFLRDRTVSHLQYKGRDIMLNHVFCMMSARGKYIAICEGDDYWTDPLKLEKQVAILEDDRGAVICDADAVIVDAAGRKLETHVGRYPQGPRMLEDILLKNDIITCTVMWRNGVLGELPEWWYAMPMGDWPLYVLLAQHGHIKHLDEITAAYRTGVGYWSTQSRATQLKLSAKASSLIRPHVPRPYRAFAKAGQGVKLLGLARHLRARRVFLGSILAFMHGRWLLLCSGSASVRAIKFLPGAGGRNALDRAEELYHSGCYGGALKLFGTACLQSPNILVAPRVMRLVASAFKRGLRKRLTGRPC